MFRLVNLLTAGTLAMPSAAPAGKLRGTVLHADGTPAAGATGWAAAVIVQPPLRQRTVN